MIAHIFSFHFRLQFVLALFDRWPYVTVCFERAVSLIVNILLGPLGLCLWSSGHESTLLTT